MFNIIDFKNENYKYHRIFLFFDLLQTSKDILELSHKHNIIILVGDTASYLGMFLENERKYFNLPFSNKPFGCFNIYHAEPIKDCKLKEIYTPTYKNLKHYFKYLDTKTWLTRKYVKQNWNSLILVDSSSGTSIHGLSIFLNLYAGNIKIKKDEICKLDIDCVNIENARPLQFINLYPKIKLFNRNSELTKQIFRKNEWNTNFHPDLIIPIGIAEFMYSDAFKLIEMFPRFVPIYHIKIWNKDPEYGNQEFLKIKKLFIYLLKIYKNINTINKKEQNKGLALIKKITKIKAKDNLKDSLDNLNMIVLFNKNINYFENSRSELQN